MSSRYPLVSRREGYYFGTSSAKKTVQRLVGSGAVKVRIQALQEADRLDIIAHRVYGDASLWWIIAAASNIGWGLQVPPGTRLIIPVNVATIIESIG